MGWIISGKLEGWESMAHSGPGKWLIFYVNMHCVQLSGYRREIKCAYVFVSLFSFEDCSWTKVVFTYSQPLSHYQSSGSGVRSDIPDPSSSWHIHLAKKADLTVYPE